mgnify:CR=1 FL=1
MGAPPASGALDSPPWPHAGPSPCLCVVRIAPESGDGWVGAAELIRTPVEDTASAQSPREGLLWVRGAYLVPRKSTSIHLSAGSPFP